MEYISSLVIAFVFCASTLAFIVYTFFKLEIKFSSKKSMCIWFITFVVIIVSAYVFGRKQEYEICLDKIEAMNVKMNNIMLESKSLNTEVISKENQKLLNRSEQKVKIVTKIERLNSDEFKDYYTILNEASRNPSK